MVKGERFWGIERDRIAADVLKLPVEEWTITMLANMVEIPVNDEPDEALETFNDFFEPRDWWETHHTHVDLPRGVQLFQMHKLDGESDDCHFGIADFSSVIQNNGEFA